MHRTRAALLLPLLLAACGGASTATNPAATAPAGGDTNGPAATTPVGGEPTALPPSPDGGNTGGGTASAMCDALTLAEVSDAAGVEVTTTLSTEPGDGSHACTWSGADNTPIAAHTLITPESPIPPQTAFDSFTAGGEAISGMGDRAVWATLGETEFGQLYVMVGANLYTIASMASDPDTAEHRKTGSIELAKLAIPRLP
jgi:hypothetical protein